MEQTPNIYQRILAVMGDLNYVQKGEKTVNNQYRFVSHDAVSAAVHPLLVRHGIAVIPRVVRWAQDGNRTAVDVEVDFVNVDTPDDRFTVPCFGYGIDPQDKGPGKAVSYATKYAMLKTLVLETGDDPEKDNIDHVGAGAQATADKAKAALDQGDWATLIELNRDESYKEAWKLLGSKDRSAIKALETKRDEYRDQLQYAARHEDSVAVWQLVAELDQREKLEVWAVLDEDTKAYIKGIKETAYSKETA